MNTLFDLFGFLVVILHDLDLVAQSVLLGSVSFALFIADPIVRDSQRERRAISAGIRRIIVAAALATLVAVIAATVVRLVVLGASLYLSLHEIVGAHFAIAGSLNALATAAIGLAVFMRPLEATATRITLVAAGALVLYEALAISHAAARLDDSRLLLFATGAHELGAALWLGGLPCLWLALRRADSPETALLPVAGIPGSMSPARHAPNR